MRRTIKIISSIAIAILISLSAKAQVGLSIPIIPPSEGYVVGDTVKVPVYADSSLTGKGALALTMRLTYNDFYLVPLNVETDSTILKDAGWSVTPNLSDPDVITIASAGTSELTGSGALFYINFKLVRQGTGYIYFDQANTFFNESIDDIPISYALSYGYVSIGAKPTISVSLASSGVIVLGDSVQAFVSGQENPTSWSVTDTSLASIKSNGMIQSKAFGTVGIIAEDNRGIIDTTDLRILGFRLTGSDTTNFVGQEVSVSINASDLTTLNAQSGSFFLNTSSGNNFEVLSIDKGPLLDSGASITYNKEANGISIAFAQTTNINGAGELLRINIKYSDENAFTSSASFSDVLINESLEGRGNSFTIRSLALPALSISRNTLPRYLVGDSLQFSVTNNTGPVSWSVTNPALATIDQSGKMISTKGGTFKVAVEDSIGAKSESSNLTFYDTFVQFPDTSMLLSDTLFYPVRVSNIENSNSSILSGDITFTYNTNNLDYLGYSTSGALSEGWSFAENQLSTTQVKLVGGGANTIESSGDFMYLKFKVDTTVSTDQYSYIYINDVLFNEGEPNYTKDDGQIFISTKPLTPTLVSPVNNAENITLNTILDWDTGVGADSYDVQLSTNPSFTSLIIDTTGVIPTELSVSDLAGSTTHYWRVKSVNSSGESNWSSYFYFRTADPIPASPVLTSPTDGAINQPLTTVGSWSSVTYADSFRVELSSKNDFSTLLLDSTIVSSQRNMLFPDLQNDSTYYWRVFASNESGESTASESRVFTTIVELPETPLLIIPADSLVQSDTVAFFSWYKSDRATNYTLELTTTEDFSVVDFSQTGLIDTVTFQENLAYLTQYYWRVKATNVAGDSDWSTVRTFETKAQDAVTPSLLSPSNNANQIDTAATFLWNTSTAAVSYRFQLANDPGFISLVSNQSALTDTTVTVTGLTKGTNYYWKVKAFGAQDSTGWSSIYSFTTEVELPEIPVLSAPSDNATEVSIDPIVSWFSTARADSFNVQLSTASDFSSVLFESMTADTSSNINGLTPFTEYYWRVKASNLSGDSDFSSPFSFTTAAIPAPIPVLLSPVENAVNVDTALTLQWSNNAAALSYQVQLSDTMDFSSTLFDVTDADTSLAVTGLAYFTDHYWRVRSVGFGGDTSAWTSTSSFKTIIEIPEIPVLSTPSDNATEVSIDPIVSWFSTVRADSFNVQLSTASDFSSVLFESMTADTSSNISGLTPFTEYYWRVKASNLSGDSDYSSPFSFITAAMPAPIPVLLSPVENAVNVDTALTLQWSNNAAALSYQVQLSDTMDFSSTLFDVTDADTSLAVTGLAYFTDHYWRVRSVGFGGDTSAWSSTSSFMTKSEELSSPMLLSPGNNSTDISADTAIFVWTNILQASEYNFELSIDTTSTPLITNTVEDSTITYLNLFNSTKFYWRIQAVDTLQGRQSVWTPWFNFTVEDAPNLPPVVISSISSLSLDEDFGTRTVAKLDTVFSDPESVPLLFEIVSATDLVSSTIEGDSLIFTSVLDTSGVGQIILRATDDIGQEVLDTLTVNVNSINDLPYVLQIPDTLSFTSGESLGFKFDTSFADVEDQLQDLTFAISVDPSDIVLGFDPLTFTVSLSSPTFTGLGSITFTVTDSDGGVLEVVLIVEVKMATSNEFETGAPREFELSQNYPNPFNPSSTIRFGVPEASDVRLEVYNMLGQKVSTLVNQKMQAGWHTVQFDAAGLSTGTYIYRIQAGDFVSTKKMMLIK